MKKITLSVCLQLATCLLLISCQKQLELQDQDPEEEVEQPTSTSPYPKKITMFVPVDKYTETQAVDYDTLNNTIRIYWDNPNTAQPFDILVTTYRYNNEGYLIEYDRKEYFDDTVSVLSKIKRNAQNQIEYITNIDEFQELPDTCFFTYTNAAPPIQLALKHQKEDGYFIPGTAVKMHYNYDASGLLQEMSFPDVNLQIPFVYNQNRFSAYSVQYEDTEIKVNVGYAGQAPASRQDKLLELILGKDYYLQPIRDMYFLPIFRDSFRLMLSATDPARPTSLRVLINVDGEEFIDDRIMKYEDYQDGRLHFIRSSWDNLEQILEFVY